MTLATEPYRPAKELPFRLRQQTVIFFNERQYLQGFDFLNALLTAGTSTPNHVVAAYIPLPQQLALAATLSVHPQFTTRAKSDDDLFVANEALKFLHNVNKVIGPVKANFATAFTFQSLNTRQSRRRFADSPREEIENEGYIRSAFASEKSLFAQVDDVWQVIGWAFNCSIAWKSRWERWKLWVELFLDIVEDDWKERGKIASGNRSIGPLRESLLMQYLTRVKGRTERRRLMRAVLADGGKKAMSEFPEIFENETKERKVRVPQESRELNLDQDQWGDYGIDEEEDEFTENASPLSEDLEDTPSPHSNDFGGLESVLLRQRFLMLLANAADALPNVFTGLEDLFDLYTESLRALPLNVFAQFLPTLQLPTTTLCGLLCNLLIPYLTCSPKSLNIFDLSQDDLVRHFLPVSSNANGNSDNTKVSLLLEALLMNMMSEGKLHIDRRFGDIVQEGIRARKEKVIGDTRRKGKGSKIVEAEARKELEESSERIMAILEILETEAGIPPRHPFADASSSPLSSAVSLPPEIIDLTEDSTDEDTIHVKID